MKRTFVAAASAALVSAASVAHAQQSPPSPTAPAAEAPAEEEDFGDDIVVVAEPGDQVRIDRRTYTLRDDPAAQSTNMFDVLGRVPSVSVAPSGAVTLLGADNVTIQINGQPVPGTNLEQVLRGITGAEVQRIEVITNPGAQHSAAASGGIINIITRQRLDGGLTGNVQAGYDTMGSYHLGVSPNWSRGPWSLSGGFGGWGGAQSQDFTRERRILSSGDTTLEEGDQDIEFGGFYVGRATVGYRPTEKQRFTLALDLVRGGNDITRDTETTESGAPASAQTNLNMVEFYNQGLTFEFQQDGALPRELLKANINVGSNGVQFEQEFAYTPLVGTARESRSLNEQDTDSANARLEYERPFGEERFLSAGLNFDISETDIETARTTLVGPAIPADFSALLEGRQQTLAGYGTFQFEAAGWTWQPGVRLENYRREVMSGGLESDDADLRTFPSIHVRRGLSENVNLDLSYTSRIQRPGFQQLDPALRFVDVNRATRGNPDLEPSLTDAYEANLTYQNNGRSLSLTFYDRISDDIFSPFTETLLDGTILTTTVNAGTSEQRGLQAIVRGPISEHWRYSANVNLMEREFDFLSGGVTERRNEFEYDGAVSLDYRDPDQNAIDADQVQFELRFQGPRHTLQSDLDEFVVANVTWRRKLADRIYGTLSAQDLFGTQTNFNEITTDTYFERTEIDSAGTRVRFAITYQFGDGPQRPPPDQQQPGGPPIGTP
ncbi:TonB-dependent receptor plug domain-containing protein [Vitreimonas flagellata]|uniref:TonB-dependent receptor plug domain-containing protein n=1 Tax=Vitreimonas flagellata TaxID=2560861 RepID=UPI001074F14B|nr:TonB-dependent receptor [Vitreimonas flagellata]